MNATQLVAHFERMADAPDAMPRLRQLILDLAVRGKLVAQDGDDDKAAIGLIERIHAAREELVRRGEIKKRDELPPIEASEVPFPLPVTWVLVRLGDALHLVNGLAFKPSDWTKTGLRIVRIQNLNNPDAPFNYTDTPKPEKAHIDNGDFLISWSGTPGTSFGAHIWERGHAILNQHIFKTTLLADAFVPRFLKTAINARLLELIDQAHGGVGLQHITKPKLERLPLTLPPLAEQHRIVAKVDELMALCDELEAAQKKRESRRDRLVAASLQRLSQPDDDMATFREHARFHLQHLPRLATTPEHVARLRQTILSLAARGRLVRQDPNDEPAHELLNRIGGGTAPPGNKQTTGRRGQARGNERVAPPFDLPEGWCWASVQQLLEPSRTVSYGVIKLGQEPKDGGVPTLRCSDVKPRYLVLSGVRRVSEDIEREYARTRLAGGEIVLNIRGTLGGVALVPPELRGFNVAREVAVIPISAELAGNYVMNVMASPYFWEAILADLRGIAYKGLNLGALRLFPVPLPPVPEQHRIVAKVDELMALCDQLEEQLTTQRTEGNRLLEAVLHQALAEAA